VLHKIDSDVNSGVIPVRAVCLGGLPLSVCVMVGRTYVRRHRARDVRRALERVAAMQEGAQGTSTAGG
jgi:hypothetical protein